jgi:hypothetical protein
MANRMKTQIQHPKKHAYKCIKISPKRKEKNPKKNEERKRQKDEEGKQGDLERGFASCSPPFPPTKASYFLRSGKNGGHAFLQTRPHSLLLSTCTPSACMSAGLLIAWYGRRDGSHACSTVPRKCMTGAYQND